MDDPYRAPAPPAADRGARGGRGRGGAAPPAADRGARGGRGRGAPAGRGGRAHREKVMGAAGSRANKAALDAAMAAELARNTLAGVPGDNPVNDDQPPGPAAPGPAAPGPAAPGPFDKLSKMEYKHLARKLDIQHKTNRIVSTYLEIKTEIDRLSSIYN